MKEYNRQNVPLAKKLRHEQTEWERKLWYCYLSKYPVKFQRQKPIGEHIVDFYCSKAKLAVELDGYYHTTEEQYKKDLQRTKDLEKQGVTVLRFFNREIETEFDAVCRKIDSVVKNKWG